ncbi:MAG: ribosome maturation factor RimM [Oscillospiraceae bacterium]|jgi:16S rRNA processing protein RimM|nr:ribosome maturation factor RimM [Oscillospiraceae bacterium]
MIRDYLELGSVVGAHGLQGELRVHPACDSPAFCCQFRRLWFDPQGERPAEVLAARPHKNVALLRLNGITTLEQAQALRAQRLFFRRADAQLEEGQYFIAELLDCSVIDADNPALCYGTLCDVSKTGANDVWHIRRPDGAEALIPVIASVVKEVDVASGVIRITPLEGLF